MRDSAKARMVIIELGSAKAVLTKQSHHSGFDCAVAELSDWLKGRALQNEGSRASRTFGVAGDGRVVEYYALATGAVAHAVTEGRVRRNRPQPIPVMVWVRLVVARARRGTGLGSSLLRDALLRTLAVAEGVGIRAILLHAISEDAKRFYVHRLHGVTGRSDDDDDHLGGCRESHRDRPGSPVRRPLAVDTSKIGPQVGSALWCQRRDLTGGRPADQAKPYIYRGNKLPIVGDKFDGDSYVVTNPLRSRHEELD